MRLTGFMIKSDSGLGERGETEGTTQFDERESFVGGGHGAAEAGFEEAAFNTDEIGGEERFFFETCAAERGALGRLLNGAGGDGETLGRVGVREAGLLNFEADAERGFAEHFFHLRELGGCSGGLCRQVWPPSKTFRSTETPASQLSPWRAVCQPWSYW
jgi:hypothetical protein